MIKQEKAGSLIAVVVLLLAVVLVAVCAPRASAAELSWTLPTTRANGEPIVAGELTAITVYAGNSKLAALGGDATRYTVPDCASQTYRVTASIGDFESEPSNSATVVPAASACRPKPPTGVGIAGVR